MKSRNHSITLGAIVAFMLILASAIRGADTPPAQAQTPTPDTAAPPAAAQPAEFVATPAPAATVAPADVSAATSAPTAAAAPAKEAEVTQAPPAAAPAPAPDASTSGLRRLDHASEAPAGGGQSQLQNTIRDSVGKHLRAHHASRSEGELVDFWRDVVVDKGEKVCQAVAIIGDTRVDGEVTEQAVSIWGSTVVNGTIGNEAVSVFGSTTVNGSVGEQAVAVGGNLVVNGHVGGEAVCVGGDVTLGPDAEVGGDVVVVGGVLKQDPAAIVHGEVHSVRVPVIRPIFAWITSALLHARLLSFEPAAAWAWMIAAVVLGFYVLLALVFPGGIAKCAGTLEQKPGHVILTALLTMLAMPLVFLLLAITGVGVLVIPFLAVGLFAAKLFGRAAMMAWIGRRFTGLLGGGLWSHAAVAVACGGVIVALLYTVPILAFLVAMLIGFLGLGTVIYALILSMRRNGAGPAPAAPAVAPSGTPPQPAPAVALAAGGSAGIAVGAIPPASPAATVPPLISAAMMPRAGFWIRMAALLIDVILCAIVFKLVPFVHFTWGAFLLILATYGAVMWKHRGTTVGGSICHLKVVRLDDRPLDWTCSIVRALSCFLSLVVAGFGFLWIAFDEEKQSWHDKIAGTTVVTVPKGVALI